MKKDQPATHLWDGISKSQHMVNQYTFQDPEQCASSEQQSKQEGNSGPESLTSLYYLHQSYKLMRPLERPIFGPRSIIWTNLVEVH